MGYDSIADNISDEYQAGAFLIYDCLNKHWVCVLEENYRECETKRNDDKLTPGIHHSCAPIGQFPNKRSCFQRQLFMVTHHHGQRFCVNDAWKQRVGSK